MLHFCSGKPLQNLSGVDICQTAPDTQGNDVTGLFKAHVTTAVDRSASLFKSERLPTPSAAKSVEAGARYPSTTWKCVTFGTMSSRNLLSKS